MRLGIGDEIYNPLYPGDPNGGPQDMGNPNGNPAYGSGAAASGGATGEVAFSWLQPSTVRPQTASSGGATGDISSYWRSIVTPNGGRVSTTTTQGLPTGTIALALAGVAVLVMLSKR